MNDRFSCAGYYTVGGWHIKCHKVTGHGSNFTLAYGLQMSCNPTMMQLAERIGAENFYRYVEKFGYLEGTGVDLPSEANTIFHQLKNIGPTELATASFGQRFKTNLLRHLTAIAAVANGGYKVTPHVVEKITDADGTTVAETFSDFVYVTSDNSRSENPISIFRDIKVGFEENRYAVVYKREKAIRMAIDSLRDCDTLLIAGKGTEKYIMAHFEEDRTYREKMRESLLPFSMKDAPEKILSALQNVLDKT